jgi:hypothetical protein
LNYTSLASLITQAGISIIEIQVDMMKKISIYILLLIHFLFIGCNSNDNHESNITEQNETSEEIVYIDHYMWHCRHGDGSASGSINGFCMRIRNNVDSDWNAVDTISGFDFEWGYRYKLKVLRESDTRPEIPEGAPSEYYTLIDLLEKEAVGPDYLFDLHVVTGQMEIIKEEGIYSYSSYPIKEFVCSPEICSALDSLIEQELNVRLEMRYQDSPEDPMVLTQIKCSAPYENYNDDCK